MDVHQASISIAVNDAAGKLLMECVIADNPTWGAPRIHGELIQLGFAISEPTVSRYLRQLNRQCDANGAKRWLTFLNNHREVILRPSISSPCRLPAFRVLYCFFVIEHGRRKILHFHATSHPTSE